MDPTPKEAFEFIQNSHNFHPYTCETSRHAELVWDEEGNQMICPDCAYTQALPDMENAIAYLVSVRQLEASDPNNPYLKYLIRRRDSEKD